MFEFSHMWGLEGLLLCLRLTVTESVLRLVYADGSSVCTHTHTRFDELQSMHSGLLC